MKDYQFNAFVGLAGFAGVIGLVFWLLFEMAKAVKP